MALPMIAYLDKRLQDKAGQFLERAAKAIAPSTVKITSTWRSPAAQNKIFCKGLSQAKAGQSPHNCTLPGSLPAARAFDFSVYDEQGNYIKNGSDQRYTICGNIICSLGLIWGGNWQHGVNSDGTPFDHRDYDHAEMPNWHLP